MLLTMIRTVILAIGWPVLIAGSIYILAKGKNVYDMVKGSLVGKLVKALVVTMLVEMYSLGVVATSLMMVDVKYTYLVIPIFIVWFATFVWAAKTILKAKEETAKLTS